jgi:hypothetical protein
VFAFVLKGMVHTLISSGNLQHGAAPATHMHEPAGPQTKPNHHLASTTYYQLRGKFQEMHALEELGSREQPLGCQSRRLAVAGLPGQRRLVVGSQL